MFQELKDKLITKLNNGEFNFNNEDIIIFQNDKEVRLILIEKIILDDRILDIKTILTLWS